MVGLNVVSCVMSKTLLATKTHTHKAFLPYVRQQCRLTICIELDELTNSEAAAATPPTVIQNL